MALTGSKTPPRIDQTYALASVTSIALLVLGVLGLSVLFFFNPIERSFYPVCIFHQTTGLLCPGCGSLRAMHQLLHGNLVAALHMNLLLVISLPFFLWQAVRLVAPSMGLRVARFSVRPAWWWWGFGIAVAFGIARNLPFAQTLLLAP